jgi:hypothetical protein
VNEETLAHWGILTPKLTKIKFTDFLMHDLTLQFEVFAGLTVLLHPAVTFELERNSPTN